MSTHVHKISSCFEMQPKWNFMWIELVSTPVWNPKPVWVYFASHVNVLLLKGRLVIRFVHGRTSYGVYGRGVGFRGKQFMTFSVSVKHQKDKKIFLHTDLLYSFTKTIKRVFIHCLLFVVQSSIKHHSRLNITTVCCLLYNQALSFIVVWTWLRPHVKIWRTKTRYYQRFNINYYNTTALLVQIKIIQSSVINKNFNSPIINKSPPKFTQPYGW